MRLRLYGEYNEEEDKRGEERDAGAEGDGRRGERQRDGEEGNGGKAVEKSLTVPRWDQRRPTSDAAVGQHQQHLRTARCGSRRDGGGEGGREELGGEADDVKRFELFRRPLHHM